MATYDEIAQDVMNWSNRDTSVLPYKRIKQCIDFAHDEIYRTCRIASMEGRFNYLPLTQEQAEAGTLEIPPNTVEFIQLRKKRGENQSGNNSGSVIYLYDVAEARNDIRSFYGDTNTKYSDFTYSRERNNLVVYPGLKEGEEWELYYYYRFEDPHARVELVDRNVASYVAIDQEEHTRLEGIEDTIPTLNFVIYDALHSGYSIDEYVAFNDVLYKTTTAVGAVESWSITEDYDVGDFVQDKDKLYIVDVEVAGVDAWDGQASYTTGDQVSFGTNLYEAAVDIAAPAEGDPDNDDPTVATDDWTEGAAIETFEPAMATGSYSEPDDDEKAPLNPFNNSGEIGLYDSLGSFPFTGTDTLIVGAYEDNWFRDQNEKALLFGALHQAFDYLDEQDQSQKFKAKFEQELDKLNKEEMMRQTRGGNIQTNFYNGLI